MKLRVYISICLVFIVLSQGAFALGQKVTGNLTAIVYVKSLFQLSISNNAIDFKNAAYGKTLDSDKGVSVISKSTGSDSWYIYVSNNKPLTAGKEQISNDNFSWIGDTKGTGDFYGDQYRGFSTSPRVAYKSSDEEIGNLPSGTQNDFKFRLFIPEAQPAGDYASTIIFTMTE